jgi:mannose-6-phosphate isomerase-like protein (cupin superfamily)
MDANKDAVSVVDLAALAQESAIRQPLWAYQSADLNVNLLVWGADEGVVEHVNSEVDVLLVGLAGDGLVEVDGTAHPLRAGQAVIIPKGARRAIRSTHGRFAYLTCHRRRAGLWPHRLPHPAGDQGT